ncbi:MAG TPA: hypothetical protein VGK88_10155 [bacterium]|jgi:hypothetical protein
MRLATLLVIVLSLTVPAAAQVTVKGDPAAWQEVVAAYQRLGTLRSYRMKVTGPGVPGLGISLEIVNPDRTRTLVDLGNGGYETIVVGKEARGRVGDGPWQCQAPPVGLGAGLPDPKAAKGEVTIARLRQVTIDGARTQSYQSSFSTASTAQPISLRLYVLQSGGVLRRVEILDKAGKITISVDYYDFNAPIKIELPECAENTKDTR